MSQLEDVNRFSAITVNRSYVSQDQSDAVIEVIPVKKIMVYVHNF